MTPDNEQRLQELFTSYVDLLNSGEELDPERILAEQPILGIEIIEYLEDYIATAHSTDSLLGDSNAPLGTLGDYTLRRQIGRGGMGVVYEAWENSMDRAVALKVLPGAVAADEKALQRFVREAKVAGDLHHPNVVPVYGMGLKEKTPYYAMEYVEGETLAQILGRLGSVAEDGAEGETGKLLSSLVELLEKGSHVSTTEAIVPDSKTMDLEGEGQGHSAAKTTAAAKEITPVYCYRLAAAFASVTEGIQHAHSKGVIHRDIKPSNLILDGDGRLRILDFGLARLEGQESLTTSGDLLGTVQYMSPEQAMARRIPIDHRTDVYSLGATLYEMLTFRPPFEGKNYQDTLSKIVLREPQAPRRVNSRIPADLETIVLKCLRKDATDRYGTAEALAQDLHRFVRGDAIEARPQPGWERLARRAWQSRGRLAIAGLAALLFLTSGLLFYHHRREAYDSRLVLYRDTVLGAIAKIEQGRSTRELRKASGRERHSSLERQSSPGVALAAVHSVEALPDPVEEAVAELEAASELFPEKPDAYYHLAVARMVLKDESEAVAVVAQALACDGEFVPALILEATILDERGEKKAAEARKRRARELRGSGWTEAWLKAHEAEERKHWKKAAEAYGELIRLERGGGEHHLGFSMTIRLGRGRMHLEAEDFIGAIEDFAGARDRWPQLLEPVLLLGKTYCLQGDWQRAEKLFEELEDQVGHEPDINFLENARVQVADLYHELGDYEKALRWLEKQGESSMSEGGTADLLRHLGRLEEAVDVGRKAVRLDPKDVAAHHNLGLALHDQGELEEAIAAYRRAIELDPKFAEAHVNLGNALKAQGKLEAAIAKYRKAAELAPKEAPPHNCLGVALFDQGRLEEAIAEYQKAIELDPKFAVAHNNLANARAKQGKLYEAIAEFRKAIQLDPKDAGPHYNLGTVRAMQGNLNEAIAEYRKAIELDPQYAGTHNNLGCALQNQGNLQEAIAEYEKAIDLDPKYAGPHINLGNVLKKQGKLEAAIVEYQKAIELAPREAMPHLNLGLALHDQGELEAAIAEYHKAIELDPDEAGYHVPLGDALLRVGRLEAAEDAYRKAIALGADDHHVHCMFAQALTRLGKLEAAFSESRKAVGLFSKCPATWKNLNQILRTKEKLNLDTELPLLVATLEKIKNPKAPVVLSLLKIVLGRIKRPEPSAELFLLKTLALALTYDSPIRNPDKAVEYARLLVEKTGGLDLDALGLLAETQFRGGQREDAILTLEKAVSLPGAGPRHLRQLDEYRGPPEPQELPLRETLAVVYEPTGLPSKSHPSWRFTGRGISEEDAVTFPEPGVMKIDTGERQRARWLSDTPDGFAAVELEQGFTVEIRLRVLKSTASDRGTGFEAYSREGSPRGRRYRIAITTTAVLWLIDNGDWTALAEGLDNSTAMHTYRMAVRGDGAAQIYRDGELIGVRRPSYSVDPSLPPEGPYFQWGESGRHEADALVDYVAYDVSGPTQPASGIEAAAKPSNRRGPDTPQNGKKAAPPK